jgi:biotin synthase
LTVRTDWTREEIAALFDLPFDELVYQAATVHRAHHAVGQIQLCTLLSIKTGGCPEDCGYCSQSVKADSGVEATKLMDVQAVLQKAAQAADNGSRRFCMGAAWRNPKDRDMPAIVEIVKGVRQIGMETCMTLGMLTPKQADMLAEAGLDYYNHNIDTSPERYNEIITTRTMDDRLDTLSEVAALASTCAAAALSAWAKRAPTGWASSTRWRPCQPTPKAFRSTRWCR